MYCWLHRTEEVRHEPFCLRLYLYCTYWCCYECAIECAISSAHYENVRMHDGCANCCALCSMMQCSAAKSSEYDGDTSLCVWSNRASAVIASSLLLQAMRAAFPNPGPGTGAKDITKERGMLALRND